MAPTALITGASAGIGKAMALELASRGYSLGLMARRTDKLEATKKEIQAKHPQLTVCCAELDVTDFDAVQTTIQDLSTQLGAKLDLVIANSGITGVRPTGKGNFQMDQTIINTNLLGAMATADAATAVFRKQGGGGHIVGISSVMSLRGVAGTGAYAASKAGLNMYYDTLRTELLPKRTAVTLIYAGFMKTDLVPNMEKYPFVLTAEDGARQIVDAIQKRKPRAYVPAMPYRAIKSLLPLIPDSIWRKIL